MVEGDTGTTAAVKVGGSSKKNGQTHCHSRMKVGDRATCPSVDREKSAGASVGSGGQMHDPRQQRQQRQPAYQQ